ncbi:cytoplasmic protein [Novosphingobium sp. G106]|uniref:cytoplasmic protein n=1 Tax=Novosphingobium sp. G106 TaxID=2849500 RepID=UPI001C2D855A|nr:cytoplasmic protein [Novosphingobium sp. G106]MBV1689930.1 cytoplasmic protein [Novosphingobium sp. G106]
MSDDFDQAISRINDFKKNGGPVGEAHAHCSENRDELGQSNEAGCFYCCRTYAPALVEEWIDDGATAMCPKCGIDSVIGSASGFPVTELAFLKAMNEAWF